MMDRLRLLAFGIVLCVGCRAQQLKQDQDDFRCTLLQMQTDQIMDNLILAYRGMPFVHVDYTRSTGTVTTNADAGHTGSQTAAALISRVVGWSASASKTNQLTVTAEPVTEHNEVYSAYLQFLKPDLEFGDKLLCTSNPPPFGAAHICREGTDGCYYWVPAHFKHEFLELVLSTTVLRGQPMSIPSTFTATIKAVEFVDMVVPFNSDADFNDALPDDQIGAPISITPIGQQEDADHNNEVPVFDVTFSTSLYNVEGSMLLRVGDRKLTFDLTRLDSKAPDSKTSILRLVFVPTTDSARGAALPTGAFRFCGM